MELLIDELFEIGCIKTGEFTLKSGQKSPIYFDMRNLIPYPSLLQTVAQSIVTTIGIQGELVAGVPMGALPLATVISQVTGKSMLMVRKDGAKSHGTKKVIEGAWNPGQTVTIVEDVITTGGSLLQVADIVKAHNLVNIQKVVILDRRRDRSFAVSSLLTVEEVVSRLISRNILASNVWSSVTGIVPYDARLRECSHPLTSHLLQIMIEKESNLCLSADLPTSKQLIDMIDSVGPSICLVKLHRDLVTDWSVDTENQILKLAQKHNFMTMEDRKIADIASIALKQIEGINTDLITVHSIAGPGTLSHLATKIGVVVVAEMSSEGNLCDGTYQRKSYQYGGDANAVGFVTQHGIRNSKYLCMSPGVKLISAKDGMGQQFASPRAKIINGADIIIVGRGIYTADNPVEMAEKYRTEGWSAYLSLRMELPIPIDLTTHLDLYRGLRLDNCIYNGSCPAGSTYHGLEQIDQSASGAVVTKTCTIDPITIDSSNGEWWSSNEMSINRVGMVNKGVDFFSKYTGNKPYIVSVNIGDIVEAAPLINKNASHIDAVEINLLCPNHKMTPTVLESPETLKHILNTSLSLNVPYGVKLPPFFDSTEMIPLIDILKTTKVSFVVCCNAIGHGLVLDSAGSSVLSTDNPTGSIGGSVVNKAVGLANVQFLHQYWPGIRIVGLGGIRTGKDVFEYLSVGASAVQVVSQLLIEGVECFERLTGELCIEMRQRGFNNINEIHR